MQFLSHSLNAWMLTDTYTEQGKKLFIFIYFSVFPWKRLATPSSTGSLICSREPVMHPRWEEGRRLRVRQLGPYRHQRSWVPVTGPPEPRCGRGAPTLSAPHRGQPLPRALLHPHMCQRLLFASTGRGSIVLKNQATGSFHHHLSRRHHVGHAPARAPTGPELG